jgi:hypothetical protein
MGRGKAGGSGVEWSLSQTGHDAAEATWSRRLRERIGKFCYMTQLVFDIAVGHCRKNN